MSIESVKYNLYAKISNVRSGVSAPGSISEKVRAFEYAKTRTGLNHKTFCYAPSVNMYFAQDGSVKACCHNMELSIGKFPEQSLKEIWNSDKARLFRKKMENYSLDGGCDICAIDYKNKNFYEVRARHFDSVPKHDLFPTMMEFLLTNTCNLECVMCQGEFSSLIRKNREKLPALISPYNKEFIKQLEEFIPHLYETRFSGSGEAFSIDMNYEIWEMIIALNPKCLIMVQTNGTILTERVKNILSRGNFQIGVSLDSLKKNVFEAIRINANFDKVIENLNYFSDYSKHKKNKFSISTCVMRQNWRELPEFINFANKHDAIATFHKVWFPEEYGLHNLSKYKLQEIHKYLSGFDFSEDTLRQKTNRNHYHYFVSVVKDWIDNPGKVSDEVAEVNSLSGDNLLQYLNNKIQIHFSSLEESEQKRNELSYNTIKRIENFLELFSSNEEKDIVLKQICVEKIDVIIDSYNKYPVEYLFQESMKFIQLKKRQESIKPI